jgi:hypothetical protein
MEMILKRGNYSYKPGHVFMGGKDRFILTNSLSDHFSFPPRPHFPYFILTIIFCLT